MLELPVDLQVKPTQHREPGGGGERVPGERARLVDVADRSDALHQLGSAAEGRQRQAAADDLAEYGQIGQHAVSSCAPPRATRKPVITSSKTSSAPLSSQTRRSPSRNPPQAGRHPCSRPPARRRRRPRPSIAASTAWRSLYGDHAPLARRLDAERPHAGACLREERVGVTVIAAGESARTARGRSPRVPAAAWSSPLPCPRRRAAPARRTAPRRRSRRRARPRPRSPCRRSCPRRAAATTASIVSGSACPKISGPQESTQSR